MVVWVGGLTLQNTPYLIYLIISCVRRIVKESSSFSQIFKQAPDDKDLRTNLAKNQDHNQNNKRLKQHAPGPPVNHMTKPQVTATAMSVSTPVPQSPRSYANPGLPYGPQQQNRAKYRPGDRPIDVYNPTTGSKLSSLELTTKQCLSIQLLSTKLQ